MAKHRARSIIQKFSKAKILVIGDLILDEYLYGDAERISPEAPVPVVLTQKKVTLPGGAANVASNISSLEGSAHMAGVVGKDEKAEALLAELAKRKINTNGVMEVFNRITSTKTRILAGNQQIVRVDSESREAIKENIQDKLCDCITQTVKKCDAVIIEDYGKGVVTPFVVTCAVSAAKSSGKIVVVDPKEEHFEYYTGVTAITPNRKETENAIRYIKMKESGTALKVFTDKLISDEDVDKAGTALIDFLKLDSLLITLGDKGMRLFEKGKKPHHIDTVAKEVFDVTGAGDTVIAVFTLALSGGATKQEAAEIANRAAGIVVGRRGVAVLTQNELIEAVEKE